MYRIITILLALALVGQTASAQTFPSTDSVRRYIDKYIRNSAVDAFTNLRLNTALKGMLNRVDSVQSQVLGSPRVVDSIWKPNDSTFRFKIRGSIYQLTDRGSGGSGGGSVTVDQVLTDGSTNAISNNAVFDALAGKAALSHTHNAATDLTGIIPTGRFGNGTIPVGALQASGTPSATTYYRGDGSWATPAGGGGTTYTGTSPINVTGSVISIPLATNSVSGYLSSTDRTAFAAKLNPADTIYLHNLINNAIFHIVGLNDSTLGAVNGFGAVVDTILYQGSFGGSSGGGGGGVSTVSASSLSPLFSTLVSNSNTTPSIAFTLSNAGAYSLFGRGAGSGLPSYLASLDSNWIPSLHTEAYYNTKYALIGSVGSGSTAWASITGKPTTLAGYGITDAASSTHTHTFASLTSKPTTLVGYGITDAASLSHTHAATDLVSGSIPSARFGATTIPVTAINATGGTSADFLRKDGTWATPAGGGGTGTTPTQVDAKIDSALNANKVVFKNDDSPGADTIFTISGDTVLFKSDAFIAGAGLTIDRVITSRKRLYQFSITGTLNTGARHFQVNTNTYTPSISNGYWQYIGWQGTSTGLFTLPTTANCYGLVLRITNTSSSAITFNVPVYESDNTSIPPGSVGIPSLGGAELIFSQSTLNWRISTFR